MENDQRMLYLIKLVDVLILNFSCFLYEVNQKTPKKPHQQ